MIVCKKWKESAIVRVLSNLKYYPKLRANSSFYQQLGLKKKVWQKISYDSIPLHNEALPWLDQATETEVMKTSPLFASFSPEIQSQLLQWQEKGRLVLPGFFDAQQIDAVEQSILKDLSSKEKQNYFTNRLLNLYRTNKKVDAVFRDERLLNILSFLLGKKIAPFQTIHFYQSSSQPAHSDAVHLTTEPLGYSVGVWVALEDVAAGSGEFFYYPGSHRLPYVMNADYKPSSKHSHTSDALHEIYEAKIAQIIEEKSLKLETFLPKKGDILIWHTNLLHGSLPKKHHSLTRKSMIMHYFVQGVLCYHEMLEKPAVFF
jgi:ectoine hydroxylase-related dioxygenase (phytanoyl-CoA dioxygenase family)